VRSGRFSVEAGTRAAAPFSAPPVHQDSHDSVRPGGPLHLLQSYGGALPGGTSCQPALSGTAVLPKASCRSRGQVTGEVERVVLRGSLWPVRIVRRLRSRRPQQAPKEFPLTLWPAGREETVFLPASEYPVLLHMPILAAPAALTGEKFTRGIRLVGVTIISFGSKPDDVAHCGPTPGFGPTMSQGRTQILGKKARKDQGHEVV
jgi:hypothetical protein